MMGTVVENNESNMSNTAKTTLGKVISDYCNCRYVVTHTSAI